MSEWYNHHAATERWLREQLAAAERREAQLTEALQGLLELDGYRPRDGSVNEEWERQILSAARSLLCDHE